MNKFLRLTFVFIAFLWVLSDVNYAQGYQAKRFIEYTHLPGGFVAWGDYDQDGNPDLITGCTMADPHAHIIHNYPTKVFTEVQTLPCGHGFHVGSNPWVDYDLDGDLDLVLPGREASYVYKNTDGVFYPDERSSLPVQYSGGTWFQTGDLDGMNSPDLVLIGVDESGIFLNDGTGLLTKSQDMPIRDNLSGDLADYDQDGDLDLVLVGAIPGGGGPFYLEIYNNTGGTLSLSKQFANRAGNVHWVDYDHDSILDIFVTGGIDYVGFAELWRQSPIGTFSLDQNQPELVEFASFGLVDGSSAWGDYNQDGTPDLIISFLLQDGSCLTRTYRNQLNGRLIRDVGTGLYGDAFCYLFPAFADFDQDGDLDLVAWQDNGNIKVFEAVPLIVTYVPLVHKFTIPIHTRPDY